MKTFEWVLEDDGYGVIGVSFVCPECDAPNRFESGEEVPHTCGKCGKESMPESDESVWA